MSTGGKLTRLVASGRAYNLIQRLAGSRASEQTYRTFLQPLENKSVLDVGGGTGLVARLLPPSVSYLCLDNDPWKLGHLRRTVQRARAVVGDATRMGIQTRSVDYALCFAVSHHLTDVELPLLFAEMARVVREGLVFHDALLSPRRRSRLLWKIDRGSYPRDEATILASLQEAFVIEELVHLSVHHRYVLCIARPKDSIRP